MEKVKLNATQAKRIEFLKDNKYDFPGCIASHINGWKQVDFAILNNLTTEEFASAWINGYELKIEPQEFLKILFDSWDTDRDKNNDYASGIRLGIKLALDALKLEIPGINK